MDLYKPGTFSDVFFRAAAKPAGPSANDLIDAIQEEYPALRGRTCYIPGQGINAYTVIIEGMDGAPNFVFKAPIRAGAVAPLEEERRRLEHLQGRGLPVPEVTHIGKKYAYFGMLQIPGVSLYEQYSSMTPVEFENLGREVGAFVAGMAQACPIDNTPEWFHADADFYDPLQSGISSIGKAMDNRIVRKALGDTFAAAERAAKEYTVVFSDEEARRKSRIITHLDLNEGNIIVDPLTKRLAGIIDFGSVGPFWPELVGVDYPFPFLKGLCEGCTANGIPVEYRHALLADFKNKMNQLCRAAGSKNSRTARVTGAAKAVEACLYELASLDGTPQPAAARPRLRRFVRRLNFPKLNK